MGRVAGSYGVRGWIRVVQPGEALAACAEWWIGGDPYAVAESKEHSGALLARLGGIESREQALKLKGRSVEVAREALPEPEAGRFYWGDLVGLAVVNTAGEPLGTVKALANYGAHDVMELAGERTRLLPWVSAVVKRVDLREGRIEVEWGADW